MLVTIILIIVTIIFCRYVLPLIILSIAGTISKNDEMTQANKQNITSSRTNGYQFSALHIIERLMIYADMLCICILLFFPKICLPFVIALFVLIVIQLFECVFALKSGNAYTWIYASMFGRRGNMNSSGGMYSGNINGTLRRPGLFGRNNQYGAGYNNQQYGYGSQQYGYNNQQYGYGNQQYGYNRQQYGNVNSGIGGVGRQKNILGSNNIPLTGKKEPDGNIQGWPVWSVGGSKKCFITEKGMIIYKLKGTMQSVTGKNISDDTSQLLFEFVTNVDDICSTVSKTLPVLMVNKNGVITKRLYVTDEGVILQSPFPIDKYPAIKEIADGILIKNPDDDYYVAERDTDDGIVISTLEKIETGYQFKSVINGKLEQYKLTEEFDLISINGKKINDIVESSENSSEVDNFTEDEDDTTSLVGGIKEVFNSLPSRSALKVKVQNLANVKLAGFGNDGVYNDGTVDVMCEFGELMIVEEKSYKPTLQALVLSKLIPALNVNDIMSRIGDGWTDSTLGKMLDDACQTIKQQAEAKESQCINYWITDDKDVFYLSFVFNGKERLDDLAISTTYSLAKKAFLKLNITTDKEIGYRCSTYNADLRKFKDNDETQNYFAINPINTTPDLFDKYLSSVGNAAEQFKRVAVFTGLTFKARVLSCVCYTKESSNRIGYCCKTYLNKSFLFDWERNKAVTKNKLRSSITTPAKLRDLLNGCVKGNFYEKYAPVFAIAYATDGDTMEVNFLFGTAEYTKEELNDIIFNTPLVTYSCYDRLDNYLLDSTRDKDVYVILFKKKES